MKSRFSTHFLETSTEVILADNGLTRKTGHTVRTADYIRGNNGHLATPPVLTFRRVASGTADTDDVNVRPIMLLPPEAAHAFVSRRPDWRFTLRNFYEEFINLPMGGTDVAMQNMYRPIQTWWRAACMVNAAGECTNAVSAATPALPLDRQDVTSWASRHKKAIMERLGIGGPGLTNATFTRGMADLQMVVRDTTRERLEFERTRDQKTFTDRYGDQIAQSMYNLCNVTDDDHLPEAHRLLATAPKSRAYAVLASLIQRRVSDHPVPLTDATKPIASTKLVDDVFRSYQPYHSGLTFGAGLSPFAICCEGHAEAHKIQQIVKKASYSEAGQGLSVADAEELTATNVLFPTTPQIAAEKLYGWSIMVDLFHGATHGISVAVRDFVTSVGPALHAVHGNAGAAKVGMDLVNRVLFEAQQDYFAWLQKTVRQDDRALRPAVPDFTRIQSAVHTYRASSLGQLPASWFGMIESDSSGGRGSNQSTTPRQASGSAPTFNAHADRDLMRRFRDSGHTTISAMMNGHDVQVPKVNGKNVCLIWALKGECSSACKRAAQHTRYNASTVRAINNLMTRCGVGEAQD